MKTAATSRVIPPSPRRPWQSLSSQIAEHLRERLRDGEWKGQLPGERVLAEQLGVSRRTVRAALEELSQDGWLAERSRQGTQLRKKRRRGAGAGESPRSVGLLLPVEMDELRHRTILWIDDVRRILYGRQVGMHVYQKGFATSVATMAFFRKLTTTVRHDCWVLPYSSPAMQQWCVVNRVPAVIVGTLHEKGSLPNVDLNYRAACQHAATQLLRIGHRQVVIVLDRQERGGDVESRLGFFEGVEKAGNTGKARVTGGDDAAVASVAYHDGTVADLCRLADRLLARKPRPTAWLIASPACFLTVIMHLLHRGVRVPEEVSLVCRDADPWLASGVPEPTRYVFDIRSLARQVARLAQKVASGHAVVESVEIIPDLAPGKTLAPPAGAEATG
ncbi:hypothetical protein OPIT5_06560 [Opitutaceae bacterium TAV5]|nr:hypothetical protein OPIT5_06560 [Opitutaceae bacterium TAV5]